MSEGWSWEDPAQAQTEERPGLTAAWYCLRSRDELSASLPRPQCEGQGLRGLEAEGTGAGKR